MNYELLVLIFIALFSLLLIFWDFSLGFNVLLVLSVLLHKELFSFYKWDFLPVRFFMLAIFAYGIYEACRWFWFKRNLRELVTFLKEPFVFVLLCLWVFRGISIIFSKSLVDSLQLFAFYSTITVLGLLLFSKLRSSSSSFPSPLSFIKRYAGIVFLLCVIAYVQIWVNYKFDFIFGAFWRIPNNLPRVGSLFWDVNHFGALLASVLPIIGVLILVSKTVKEKVYALIAFALMSGILLLTNSRTAWMVAFFAFLVFISVLLIRKWGSKGIIYLLITISLITVPLLIEYSNKASPFRAKIRNYFNYRIDSFDSHFLLLEGTIQVFEKYPFLGGGYGGFFEHFKDTKIAPQYFSRDPAGLTEKVPAHTIWGEILAETGVIGLVVFISFISLIVVNLLYISFKATKTDEILLSASMLGVIVGLMIAGVFYSYNSEFFWLILFLYFFYSYKTLQSWNVSLQTVLGFLQKSKILPILILSLIGGYLIFNSLGQNHLIVWDESIYAKISKNMLDSGDYLIQHWMGSKVWYEKPPLYMWLSAFSANLFGVNSFAFRFPSALFGLLSVLAVYFWSSKLFGRLTGFFSSIVLATTAQYLYYARSSMLDVTAGFFVLMSCYLYWLASERKSYLWSILCGVFVGLAVMTKGVVGLLPMVIFGIYELYLLALVREKLTWHKVITFTLVFVTSVLVFLPWHYYMYQNFGMDFIRNYLGYHVVDRAFSAIEDKGRPFWWYLEVLKVSMRIWFIALLGVLPLAGIQAALRKSKPHAFLLIASVLIFFLFSFATSKLIWYVIPIYPFLAILVGYGLKKGFEFLLMAFPNLNNALSKTLLIYLLVAGSLFYLFLNRNLIYLSDLTGNKALALSSKNEFFDSADLLYVDTTLEEPLVLFYAGEPYMMLDFASLKDTVLAAGYTDEIRFVTKESRFRAIKSQSPRVVLLKQQDEWVIAKAPSQYSLDKEEYKRVNDELEGIYQGLQDGKYRGSDLSAVYNRMEDLRKRNAYLDATLKSYGLLPTKEKATSVPR